MGFFDRFSGKKSPSPAASTEPAAPAKTGVEAPAKSETAAAAGGVVPRLLAARERLDAHDLPGALAIYEEVLGQAGDRADVLVTISGDLGSTGHVAQIIELVAPRYDADRHGPATGLNLLQAYLAARDAEAAQHVLDILFSLNRPELEDRLHGFSNAIAELLAQDVEPVTPGATPGAPPAGAPKFALITLSKPVWSYGLEPLAAKVLPPKEGKLRRIAFAQLALPGAYADLGAAMSQPEDELGRLSRALPLWFAETFYFSPHYAPVAALGIVEHPDGLRHRAIFGSEWTTDNLRQLVETSGEALDYVFTGAMRQRGGDYELLMRVWEVKKFRERKQFTARWTPATADVELAKLHEQIRGFMEWTPNQAGLPYAAPASPRAWLELLGASLGPFMVEKKLLPPAHLGPLATDLEKLAPLAAASPAGALAWLALTARVRTLGLAETPANVALAEHPLVAEAQTLVG